MKDPEVDVLQVKTLEIDKNSRLQMVHLIGSSTKVDKMVDNLGHDLGLLEFTTKEINIDGVVSLALFTALFILEELFAFVQRCRGTVS